MAVQNHLKAGTGRGNLFSRTVRAFTLFEVVEHCHQNLPVQAHADLESYGGNNFGLLLLVGFFDGVSPKLVWDEVLLRGEQTMSQYHILFKSACVTHLLW